MLDEDEQIADRVRGLAAERRATQDAIASILRISRKSVSARMTGSIPFAGAELLLLSRAWGVPISRFYPEAAA